MQLHKGDNVIMLTGKDRGKTGKILSLRPATEQVVVEGLNTIKRHQRARKEGQKGQIITKERAVNLSNEQIVCPKCGQATRIGHKIEGDLKLRICKKCASDF